MHQNLAIERLHGTLCNKEMYQCTGIDRASAIKIPQMAAFIRWDSTETLKGEAMLVSVNFCIDAQASRLAVADWKYNVTVKNGTLTKRYHLNQNM